MSTPLKNITFGTEMMNAEETMEAIEQVGVNSVPKTYEEQGKTFNWSVDSTKHAETNTSSELTPTGLEVRHVDGSNVVHTGELKHDGVYIDNNGYKPLVISGITEDDEEVTFNVLGREVEDEVEE